MRRSVVALAVLCLEYLLLFMTLAVLYDGPVLLQLPGLWQTLRFGTTLVAGGAVLTAAFAVLQVGRTEVTPSSKALPRFPLAMHGAGFCCCFALAIFVFAQRSALPLWAANISFCLWLASGVCSLCGLYVCTYGWPTLRRLRGYYVLLTFAGTLAVFAWVSMVLTKRWWESLAPLTLGLAQSLLELYFEDVTVISGPESVIGADGFMVLVTEQCSGIEGMALIGVFVSGYLLRLRARLRFPQALLLLPLGLAATLLLNSLRIALLVALGALISPEIAKGGFHSNAGSILFCALAVGLVYASQRWALLNRASELDVAKEAAPGDSTDAATTAYLLPLVSMLTVGLITGAFMRTELDLAYALRWVVAGAVLFTHRQSYRELLRGFSTRSVLIGAGVFVLWLLLPPDNASENSAAVQAEINSLGPFWGPAWLTLRFVGASAIVPVAEELAFRGYLQRRLISSSWAGVQPGRFTLVSFLGPALAFGALHPNWLAGTLAGGSFAFATYASGRLSDAVVAHATTNMLLCGWVLLSGSWAYL